MFTGSAEATMDAKGRFTFPSVLRDQFPLDDRRLTITKDPVQNCLLVYPQPQFDKIRKAQSKLPGGDPVVNAFNHRLFSYAQRLEIDSNGRIVVAPTLRKKAGVERELFLCGVGKKIEVWSLAEHERAEQARDALLNDPASGARLAEMVY